MSYHSLQPFLGVFTSHLAQVFIPQLAHTPSLACPGQGNRLPRLGGEGPEEGEVVSPSWGT